jgi:predicted ribosomally synthesized peptide with nif11-like leader
MSLQNAVAFIQKVNNDEAVYLEVKKLEPGDFGGLLEVASTAGFPFSLAEWEEAVEKANATGELDDKQLDNVSGGTFSITYTIPTVLKSFTDFNSLMKKCKKYSCSGSFNL